MAKAELTLEASYYNLSHDAWEPILEPVVDPDDESVYTPWTLQAEVLYHCITCYCHNSIVSCSVKVYNYD